MEPRTFGALSMGPTGNMQGTYLFMSLLTWKVIRRRTWVEMPLPGEVIDFINRKALSSTRITSDIKMRVGNNIISSDPTCDDTQEISDPENYDEIEESKVENFGRVFSPDKESSSVEYEENLDNISPITPDGNVIQDEGIGGEKHNMLLEPEASNDEAEFFPDPIEENMIREDINFRNEKESDQTHRYNLRPGRSDWREKYADHYTTPVVFTNLSIPKAMHLYGTEALASVMKEVNQLHDKGVWTPIKYDDIKNKSRIIRSLIFLKRKRDGTLKARLVADGRMQVRDNNQDISSPTVATESLFMLSAIFAAEKRQIATVDIEGAFLHGVMTNDVYMEISGQCVDILLYGYNNVYNNMIRHNKIYVRLDRALYGTIEAAKVWYDNLSTNLISKGFKPNAHDPCIFNREYDGDQLTILIHVDDLMIACKNRKGIDYVIHGLNSDYSRANVYEGPSVDYLGMIFNFNIPGEVSISMGGMIDEFLSEVGVGDDAKAESPAANYLFEIDESAQLLDENDKGNLHSSVAKALYMAKRGRPDILTAVSFLTTRVNCPNTGDYKKLKRLSSYLNITKELKLILRADVPYKLHCYTDASYAVHVDGKGRTGNVVSLGTGAFKIMSTKQNIVTKSSTEAEIVGVSDGMSSNLGLLYLLVEQGYDVKPLILYQDNKSAITLMEKGRSTSQRTKHISTRYFFVKDRIDSGEIKLVHMGTKDMIADFYTKPLQGELFKYMRDKIMGITSMVNL